MIEDKVVLKSVAPTPRIDARAVIDPTARIHKSVTIGPWCVIGPNVEIGEGCELMSHIVIHGNVTLGKYNKIHPFAVLGGDPQDLGYAGEPTFLVIGDHNTFRESTTMSRGSSAGSGTTTIGHHNAFLAYAHVGHDSVIGNHVIFINNATTGGHVTVDDYATLGGFSAVHQFCRIGEHSFLGRGAKVTRDVLPYMLVAGDLGTTHGLNLVGLKRRGFNAEQIADLKRAYHALFRRGLKLVEAEKELERLAKSTPEVRVILDLVTTSERGFVRE